MLYFSFKEESPLRLQSRVSDSLIVLLHIAMLRHDTTTDIDFGLVHALHLAESGRTIQEKRIGQSLLFKILALSLYR